MTRAIPADPTAPAGQDGGWLRTLRRTRRSTIFPASGTRARTAGYAGYAGAGWRHRTVAGTRAVAAGVMLAAAGAVAACGSPASSGTSPATAAAGGASTAAASSMATSIATATESWAVVPVSADPAFWQVFARAGNSAAWKLVTPPGVAINGGIAASADGASALTVAVRPSQDLTFTPIATTANGGGAWSTEGPIDAAVAASPDAFAADGDHLAALLASGAVETSADAGASWSTVARPGALAASPAGKGCGGAVRVTSISFGITSTELLAAGGCGASGATAVFSYSPASGWQRLSLPVAGQAVRLTRGMALVRGKSGLVALWRGIGWYAYAPQTGKTQPGGPAPQSLPIRWTQSAPLPFSGPVTASGTLRLAGAWVLLPGGRAATISPVGTTQASPTQASPTQGDPQWLLLPPLPARTSVLASGPNGAIDALAVSGDRMTVWRLAPAATVWSKVQTISVPVQSGSSG